VADAHSRSPSQLSVYRNLALAPVNGTAPNGRPFEEVIFVNDVFVCPRDALELLHQRKLQQADATCAVDWRATRSTFRKFGFNSVKMYDNWVSATSLPDKVAMRMHSRARMGRAARRLRRRSGGCAQGDRIPFSQQLADLAVPLAQVARSITGDMLRSRLDVFSEMRDGVKEVFDQPGQEWSRKRWLASQPIPVCRSCPPPPCSVGRATNADLELACLQTLAGTG